MQHHTPRGELDPVVTARRPRRGAPGRDERWRIGQRYRACTSPELRIAIAKFSLGDQEGAVEILRAVKTDKRSPHHIAVNLLLTRLENAQPGEATLELALRAVGNTARGVLRSKLRPIVKHRPAGARPIRRSHCGGRRRPGARRVARVDSSRGDPDEPEPAEHGRRAADHHHVVLHREGVR